MGPTPFSVGDLPVGHSSATRVLNFNGANAIQRWRLGRLAWSWREGRDFNGANAIQRWRHPTCPPRFWVKAIHFNGANAIQRWRRLRFGSRRCRRTRTSMGPTPFSVGDERLERYPNRRRPTSMGPTPFSVGDVIDGGSGRFLIETSMGPTPFSVGDRCWTPKEN